MGRRSLLPAYRVAAVADVAFAATGNQPARRVTKPALMPLLALHVAQNGEDDETKPLVLAGLGTSWLGDVALLGKGEGAFAVGLTSFLTAHGFYLAALTKRRGGGIGKRKWLAAAYGLAWCGLNAVLLPRTGRLRVPVIVYGTALAAMAVAALDTDDTAVAAGGALFMVSDSILAMRTFEAATIPGADGLVMATYTAAQALIAGGMMARR